MKNVTRIFCSGLALAAVAAMPAVTASANLLNEFEPNPAGTDPSVTSFELLGTAGASFDLWITSIESDPGSSLGFVDRAANVTGTYDSNGLAVVTTPDLENPSFTVILSSTFTGAIGDDLDVADSGTLDTSSLGTIFDAVGVSDSAGDDALIYGASLGGTDILYNGQFEPLNVFRDSSTLEWFQTVTVAFGSPEERIGVFAATGGPEIDSSDFTPDAAATTFGAVNPTLIPEPASLVLLGLGGVAMLTRRRSQA